MKPGRQAGLAGEAVVEPGHDPQQARLAGAVRADDADLGARVERERDVLEDRPVGRVVPGELVGRVDEFVGHASRVAAAGAARAGSTMADQAVTGRIRDAEVPHVLLVHERRCQGVDPAPQRSRRCREGARRVGRWQPRVVLLDAGEARRLLHHRGSAMARQWQQRPWRQSAPDPSAGSRRTRSSSTTRRRPSSRTPPRLRGPTSRRPPDPGLSAAADLGRRGPE